MYFLKIDMSSYIRVHLTSITFPLQSNYPITVYHFFHNPLEHMILVTVRCGFRSYVITAVIK